MREGTREEHGSEPFRHPDPAIDEALDWVVRLEAGGYVDEATRTEFDIWLNTAAAHKAAWDAVKDTWASPETLVTAQQLDIQLRQQPALLDSHREKHRRRPGFITYAVAAAACVVVMVAAAHMVSQFLPRMMADYTTDTGERREIALPDGSRMILNTHSAVALDFGNGQRGVRLLEGEAWFDVTHDPAHPFHVTGGYSEVRVKGTAFSVRVDDDSDTVALQRGAVDAAHVRKDIPVAQLAPGQMVVASGTALSPVTTFDAEDNLGWLNGRVVVNAQPLGKALAELARYFDGRVVVLNRSLLDVAVSGDYRTDRAAAAIASLATAAGGKTTVVPGGYIIIR